MGGLNHTPQDLGPITDLDLIAFMKSLGIGLPHGIESSDVALDLSPEVQELVVGIMSGLTHQEELKIFQDYMNRKN